MIKLNYSGISEADFLDAFQVLEECKTLNLPAHGFTRLFMSPGGQYSGCWWERDTSLATLGYLYKDQKFCEGVLLNFVDVQKENGRIPLWGGTDFPFENKDAEMSAIPVIFEVAYKICRRTNDKEYIGKVYEMLKRYHGWWMSDLKRDAKTGLVCGIFEECDPSDIKEQLTVAQPDLNVQLALGADIIRELAEYLGNREEASYYNDVFEDLKTRINKYMYEPTDDGYYAYMVKEDRRQTERIYNSMFDTFKRGIVPEERRDRLVELLKEEGAYNYYSEFGLRSMSKKSEEYVETVGLYKGYTSWCGNIWTLRNYIILTGLKECGYLEESAHVADQMLHVFCGNYAEFVSPTDGKGHGVFRYAWSASECIATMIEEIFGIDYCAWTDKLEVKPNLPKRLKGEKISIENVSLGNGKFVHVFVDWTGDEIVTTYDVTSQER